MYRDRERTAHLINELIGFFQHFGSESFDIRVDKFSEKIRIDIQGICPIEPPNLIEAEQSINMGRVDTMEDYYDQMLSLYEESSDLHLVAMMVDRGKISYKNSLLHIVVERDLKGTY